MKRILCFLICFGMLFSMTGMVATAADATVNYEEQGTKENPYLISEVDDYIHLTDCVKNGETFEGKYFKQTADIDLHVTSGGTTYGLSAQDVFKGVYDGSGYKIMLANSFNNMNLTTLNQGLFGTLKGTILNLTVCGHIKNIGEGGIFAYEVLDNGKILNCSFVGATRADQSKSKIMGFASTANYDAETNGPAIINSFYYGIFLTNYDSFPITDAEGAFENAYYYAFYNDNVVTDYLGINKTAEEMIMLNNTLNDNLASLKNKYSGFDFVTWASGDFTYAHNSTYKVPYFTKSYYTPISFEGEGTRLNPYKIATFNDYINLSANISAGLTFEGKYFKQTANIKADDDGTYGPASGSKFAGIYDGSGYTTTISSKDTEKATRTLNLGVFGDKLSGKVMNLNVEAHLIAQNDTGIFAREIIEKGKIVNCSYNGKLRGDQSTKKAYYGFASTANYDIANNGAAIINCYIRGALMTTSGKTSYPITDTTGGALYTYYNLATGVNGYTSSNSDIVYDYSGTSVTNDETASLYTTLNNNIINAAKAADVSAGDLMTWKQGESVVFNASKAPIPVYDAYYTVPSSEFKYDDQEETITILSNVKLDNAVVIIAVYNNDGTQFTDAVEIKVEDFTSNGINSDGLYEYTKFLESYDILGNNNKITAFCWKGFESLIPLFRAIPIQ